MAAPALGGGGGGAPPIDALRPQADGLASAVRTRFLAFLEAFTLEEVAAGTGTAPTGGAPGAGGTGGGTQQTSEGGALAPTLTAGRAGSGGLRGSGGGTGAPRPPHYVRVLSSAVVDAQTTTLPVAWAHLDCHAPALAELVASDFHSLEPALRAAVADFVVAHAPEYAVNEDDIPREFWVSFTGLPHVDRLRALTTSKIGRLTAFAGTVTRTSEVRPELFAGAFRCLECGATVRGVAQHFKRTEPLVCPVPACGNRKAWSLIKEESTFVDWQRARVQEAADEVPPGCLPRTLEVILRNDAVEAARPGDQAIFTGALVAVPDVAAITAPGERTEARQGGVPGGGGGGGGGGDGGVTGPRFLGVRELTYHLAFLATGVEDASSRRTGSAAAALGGAGSVAPGSASAETPASVVASLTDAEAADLELMRANPRLYADAARSIAPGVLGADDIKRSVLLQLVGGVPKVTPDGIRLRGDINVAIVGDPSMAKSQVLKYVAGFLPHSVYTSGRASSAAGLTASVVREADSGELCIEAGALLLANGAVCCIDEFDKMDVKDQVAIHEAMEQQTISITKAGIQATLVARTAILAGANPAGGRYDKSKPLRFNVALPPAILSRFDLLHVMADERDDEADAALAVHIVAVHRAAAPVGVGAEEAARLPPRPPPPPGLAAPYSTDQLQRYVRLARSHKPRLTAAACASIVTAYKRLRTDDAAPGSATAYRITVRQLEALIRLSEALARVRLADEVGPGDVREAVRLVRHSVVTVEAPDEDLAAYAEDGEGGGGGGGEAGEWGVVAPPPPPAAGEEGAGGAAADGGLPAAAAAAAPSAAAAAATAAAPAPPPLAAPLRVPAAKVERVKELLLMRLRSLEEAGGAGDGTGPAAAQVGGVPVAAQSQRALLEWYFDFLAGRGELAGVEDPAAEAGLVAAVVSYLVRARDVFVVVEQPARREGEGDAAYRRRSTAERLLAINPNFADE